MSRCRSRPLNCSWRVAGASPLLALTPGCCVPPPPLPHLRPYRTEMKKGKKKIEKEIYEKWLVEICWSKNKNVILILKFVARLLRLMYINKSSQLQNKERESLNLKVLYCTVHATRCRRPHIIYRTYVVYVLCPIIYGTYYWCTM